MNEAKTISLGLAGPGWRTLTDFAEAINAPNALTWRNVGITSGKALNFEAEFMEAMNTVLKSKGRVKFNLDGFDIKRALKNAGKSSYDVIDNTTNWEFNTILNNKKFKAMTDFYETVNGELKKVDIDKIVKK